MTRRKLTPEEKALWDAVRRTVNPMKSMASLLAEVSLQEEPDLPAVPPVPEKPKVRAATAAPYFPPQSRPKKAELTLGDVDRKTQKSIARGSRDIESRLDLHGLTQAEAHGRLYQFLARAQAHGQKVVLVITGKGHGGEIYRHPEPDRGVLRSVVPHWLALPEFRRYVHSYSEAHLAHGGEGALYILIRKIKHPLKD